MSVSTNIEGPWLENPKQYAPLPEPLIVPIRDNHTHLDLTETDDITVGEVLDFAESVGVPGVVQISTSLPSSEWSVELSERDDRVLAAVAIHPNEAPKVASSKGLLNRQLDQIAELAEHPRVRAIGETGLDFFRTEGDDQIREQYRSFEAHIDIARQLDLTLQIHDREAHAEVLKTLDRVGSPSRTVLHCFSGDVHFAEECVRRGYYFSFAGNVTFKNAEDLREALRVVPIELLLIETDAPFLTPAPVRGRHNAAYLIPHIARFIANEKGVSVEDLGLQLEKNYADLYGQWGKN